MGMSTVTVVLDTETVTFKGALFTHLPTAPSDALAEKNGCWIVEERTESYETAVTSFYPL